MTLPRGLHLLLAPDEMNARPSDLLTQNFLLCLRDRGPAVHARHGNSPLASGGAGEESFEAVVRLVPTLPLSAVLFPWPPLLLAYHPKLLQQLGIKDIPQVTLPRASP